MFSAGEDFIKPFPCPNKRLNIPFLVNCLYSVIDSQICFKPKFGYGYTSGLPNTTGQVSAGEGWVTSD